MNRSEHAVDQFEGGLNCSQAVLGEYADQYGIDHEFALRVACGFGGGMGRLGRTCGAVTGAIMVIGLQACGDDTRQAAARARTYVLVQAFVEGFLARNHFLACSELLGCDISTPEGFEEAKGHGLLETKCPKYVEDAVDILEQLF
jgi:C_GCAxxG_C_C family probable redox protein